MKRNVVAVTARKLGLHKKLESFCKCGNNLDAHGVCNDCLYYDGGHTKIFMSSLSKPLGTELKKCK